MNKTPEPNNSSQRQNSYSKKTPEHSARSSNFNDLAILREYESMKIQVRQLESKNRTLSSEVEQLLYEKNYS